MKKKKKYVKRDPNALSSDLIVNPIKRKVWLFLIPTFVCFVIGFVWPFASGVYLSVNLDLLEKLCLFH